MATEPIPLQKKCRGKNRSNSRETPPAENLAHRNPEHKNPDPANRPTKKVNPKKVNPKKRDRAETALQKAANPAQRAEITRGKTLPRSMQRCVPPSMKT